MLVNALLKPSDNLKLGKSQIIFTFQIEKDDLIISKHFPSESREIELVNNEVRYYFPFQMELPHIDYLAYVALNLIYPFIGSNFQINGGVSKKFAIDIKSFYKKIKTIKIDEDIISASDSNAYKNNAISFSSGADSIAAAILDNDNSVKLLLSKFENDEIKGSKLIDTLENFEQKNKFVVNSNQHLSVKMVNSNYYHATGNYSFINHVILLVDYFKLKNIQTGDTYEVFSNLGSKFDPKYRTQRSFGTWKFISKLGIEIDAVTKWITEINTTKIIIEKYGKDFVPISCNSFKDGSPCNNCVKCFRKLLISSYLTSFSMEDFKILNENDFLKKWLNFRDSDVEKWKWYATYKLCTNKIREFHKKDLVAFDNLTSFVDFFKFDKKDYSWALKLDLNSLGNVPDYLNDSFENLKKIAPFMSEKDLRNFYNHDYNVLYLKKINYSKKNKDFNTK